MIEVPEIPKPKKPQIDWEAIERDYRAGILTLRQIGADHGVSHTAIKKRAEKYSWTRDLNAKIQAKAEELVSKLSVSTEVSKATETQIIVENGAQAAAIRIGHRKDITRIRAIITAQMEELEASSGPVQAQQLRDLGEMLREPDDFGRDKLNDVYRAVISLPDRSKVAKQLAETLRIAIDLERREFGMDKAAPADDALTALIKRINTGSGSAFRPVASDPAYFGSEE